MDGKCLLSLRLRTLLSQTGGPNNQKTKANNKIRKAYPEVAVSGIKNYLTIATLEPEDGNLHSVLRDILPQIERQA